MMDLHVVDHLAGPWPYHREDGRLFVTARFLEDKLDFLLGRELNNAYLHTHVSERVLVRMRARVGRCPAHDVSVHGFKCTGNVWRLA
jgi:hypothetical protein